MKAAKGAINLLDCPVGDIAVRMLLHSNSRFPALYAANFSCQEFFCALHKKSTPAQLQASIL
jgi:hypothetical protein